MSNLESMREIAKPEIQTSFSAAVLMTNTESFSTHLTDTSNKAVTSAAVQSDGSLDFGVAAKANEKVAWSGWVTDADTGQRIYLNCPNSDGPHGTCYREG